MEEQKLIEELKHFEPEFNPGFSAKVMGEVFPKQMFREWKIMAIAASVVFCFLLGSILVEDASIESDTILGLSSLANSESSDFIIYYNYE